jgi:hypothetical protein
MLIINPPMIQPAAAACEIMKDDIPEQKRICHILNEFKRANQEFESALLFYISRNLA